jgi:hypothetical protein
MNGHYTASVVSWERHIQWSLGQAGGAVKQSSWVAEGILILCDHDLVDGNQNGLLANCGVSPKDRWWSRKIRVVMCWKLKRQRNLRVWVCLSY